MNQNITIGLGGGCHWCTEAVFNQLKGVTSMEQGYIRSDGENDSFSEAIQLEFDSKIISLKDIINVHLATHASTAEHSFREKYRSAIYYYEHETRLNSESIIRVLNTIAAKKYITKVLALKEFKASRESIQNYYKKNPDAPFCQKYIIPKIKMLEKDYSSLTSSIL